MHISLYFVPREGANVFRFVTDYFQHCKKKKKMFTYFHVICLKSAISQISREKKRNILHIQCSEPCQSLDVKRLLYFAKRSVRLQYGYLIPHYLLASLINDTLDYLTYTYKSVNNPL